MFDAGTIRSRAIVRRTIELLVVVVIAIALAYVLWPRTQTASPFASGSAAPTETPTAVPTESAVSSPETSGAAPSPTHPPQSPTDPTPSPTQSEEQTFQPVPTGYAVTINQGLKPDWTSAEAASAAATFISATEARVGQAVKPLQVISVEAMAGKNEPQFLGGPDPNIPAVWVVHSYGTFINDHGPVQYLYDEGWFIYDDHDGSMLGEALRGPIGTP